MFLEQGRLRAAFLLSSCWRIDLDLRHTLATSAVVFSLPKTWANAKRGESPGFASRSGKDLVRQRPGFPASSRRRDDRSRPYLIPGGPSSSSLGGSGGSRDP